MFRLPLPGATYAVALVGGEWVALYPEHIKTSRGRVNFPGEPVLALQGVMFHNVIYMAGQGHQTGSAWLWSGTSWRNLGPTHGVRPCAFGNGTLWVATSGERAKLIYLETGEVVSKPLPVGSQGIRFVTDQPVTGDATIFDGDIHEWIQRDDVRIGQGHEGGCIINGRLLEPGDCRFINMDKQGDQIAVGIVKFPERQAVLHWLTRAEVDGLPIPQVPGPIVITDTDPEPPPPPVTPQEPNVPFAPNRIDAVREVINENPHIDRIADEVREEITVLTILKLGGFPWGIKDRDSNPNNDNNSDDALAFRLQDGRFEIYDILSGTDGSAQWDYKGTFADGENGFFREIREIPKPQEPKPGEIEPNTGTPQSAAQRPDTARIVQTLQGAIAALVAIAPDRPEAPPIVVEVERPHPSDVEMHAVIEEARVAYGRRIMPPSVTAHLVYGYLLEGRRLEDVVAEARERGRR